MRRRLWSTTDEKDFFNKGLKGGFATKSDLFYHFNNEYFSYISKNQENDGQTLQSRNSLIGNYTETWCMNLLQPIAKRFNYYAIKGAVCPKIGLSKRSAADIAICTVNSINQEPLNIKLIIEVKMSIVNNYKMQSDNKLRYIGDYKSHKGNPSLLRSDSMLKAIGKAINIRVSGSASTKIPIIVIGNSPITLSYIHKVDFLKSAGVVQGFYSIYPNPTNSNHIQVSEKRGFETIDNLNYFEQILSQIINTPFNYFSSMKSQQKLGEIISIAAQETTNLAKADKFLKLIRE